MLTSHSKNSEFSWSQSWVFITEYSETKLLVFFNFIGVRPPGILLAHFLLLHISCDDILWLLQITCILLTKFVGLLALLALSCNLHNRLFNVYMLKVFYFSAFIMWTLFACYLHLINARACDQLPYVVHCCHDTVSSYGASDQYYLWNRWWSFLVISSEHLPCLNESE